MALRKLTDAEIKERGARLAELMGRYDRIEEEKKEQSKHLGETLKELRAEMKVVASELRDGHARETPQADLPFRVADEDLDEDERPARRNGRA